MKKIVIKINPKDLPKPRAGVRPGRKHKTKVMYNRNPKHKKREQE